MFDNRTLPQVRSKTFLNTLHLWLSISLNQILSQAHIYSSTVHKKRIHSIHSSKVGDRSRGQLFSYVAELSI